MSESENSKTIADIVAEFREMAHQSVDGIIAVKADVIADRIEKATEREHKLLRSCARWILTHDIYGNMAKELLAECKEVLHDYGRFLLSKEGAENDKV